ncbi:MAG: ArnT family glycosyltransferase [Chitinophagaceae bacterium]
MKKSEAYWPLILVLALFKFLLPVILQDPVYELQRDEFLYYEQGQHPGLGYLENPPLLSWLGSVSSWFGGSESWIKLWPCLFGAATLVFTCLIAAELGGKLFAQFLAGFSVLTGAFMRIHFLFQPNILDIFFWTLAVYFIIRWVRDQKNRDLFGFMLSLALGWWSKYSILFIGAALIPALLLSPHRFIFTRKKFYLAILAAALIILPNLGWQYTHNWPVLHHMRELRETQLRFLSPTGFITEQLLLLFPVIPLWTVGLVWLMRKPAWRFLAYTYLFVLILLMLGSGKSYYALGAYPFLLAAGGVAWEKWLAKQDWKRYALSGVIVILTLPLIPVLIPVWKPEKLAPFYQKSGVAKSGVLKWEDGRNHLLPQDFADMLGWKEITEKTERFFKRLPVPAKENTIIYAQNYGQAGSLKYYCRSASFRNKVISDNGSFILWIPDELSMQHLIYVGENWPRPADSVFRHFARVTLVDSVRNPYSRQYGNKIIFYEQIDSGGLRMARESLNEIRQRFRR